MKIDLAGAMRAATRLTQGRKLHEATRLIQEALSGPTPTDETPRDSGPRPRARRTWPLKTVIAALRKVKHQGLNLDALPGAKSRRALSVPDGAQFLTRSFSCHGGTRSYKLYVPSHPAAQRSLLVMLHGCTQDADDFAAGTRMNALAEDHGLLIAYPVQTRAENPSSCWNWFNPRDQRRDGGEPAIIAGLTGAIIAEYDADPRRIYIAGLSAGGAMAAVMGASYPDLYDAIGIHSGLPYGSATDVISAFAAMRGEAGSLPPSTALPVKTIVFHGSADRTVHPSNATAIIEAHPGLTAGSPHELTGSESGHRSSTRTVLSDHAGREVAEHWLIHGAGHAWSGGSPEGTYTDPKGPDASREMLRFFLGEDAKFER